METENFYIHLPSNVVATSPLQVGNSIGNYVTRLNRRLNLSEEWEVALTDISYTKSWYNIMKDQRLTLVENLNKITELEEVLPAGNYETIEVLLNAINRIFYSYSRANPNTISYPPQLNYNKQSNRINIRVGAKVSNTHQYLFPNFSPFLADFLGLSDSQGRQYPNIEWSNYRRVVGYEKNQEEPKLTNVNVTAPIRPAEPRREVVPVKEPERKPTNSPNAPKIIKGVNSKPDPIEERDTAQVETRRELEQERRKIPLNQNLGQVEERVKVPAETIRESTPLTGENKQTDNIQLRGVSFRFNKSVAREALPAQPLTPVHEPERRTDIPQKSLVPIEERLPSAAKVAMQVARSRSVMGDQPIFSDEESNFNENFEEEIDKDEKLAADQPDNETKKVYFGGFKEVSLYGTIRSLYVYCNIIKPVFVGNVEVPLIRRVEIPHTKNFGDDCEINYPQPQYYPLVYHEFDNIEIDIKDDTGQTIEFAFGRSAVTLHFRKRRKNVSDYL